MQGKSFHSERTHRSLNGIMLRSSSFQETERVCFRRSTDWFDRGNQTRMIPASSNAREVSGLDMNHFHILPVLRFSALRRVTPISIPTTSNARQSVVGLKAS